MQVNPVDYFLSLEYFSIEIRNLIEFYNAIYNNKLHGLPIKSDDKETYNLPFIINGYASEEIV